MQQSDKYQLDHIGVHCNVEECRLLDFLPNKCSLCQGNYCLEHRDYKSHKCTKFIEKDDRIVHPCPICNVLIPVTSMANLDQTISAHMDTDCGKNKTTAPKSYKCSLKSCKSTEFVEVLCDKCKINHCLKHRFPTSHSCTGKFINLTSNNNNNNNNNVQRTTTAATTTTTNTKTTTTPPTTRKIIEDKQYYSEQKSQKSELQKLREEQKAKYNSSEELGIIQTNGQRIQMSFPRNETLRSIQQFINSNRTDGNCSYALCSQPNGNPFTVSQLDQTISKLNLLPISTLYMIPLNRVNDNNNNNTNAEGGLLSFLNPFNYFK